MGGASEPPSEDGGTDTFPGFEFSEGPGPDSPFSQPRHARDKAEKRPSERTQARGAKRPPGSATYSTLWSLAGVALEQRGPLPVGPPVGRVMMLQAPDAGVRIARIIEQSPLAEWFKPLADNAGWVAELIPLLAPPLIVGAIAAKPEALPVMEPLLGAILVPLAIELRKQQREAAQATSIVSEMDDEIRENVSAMLDAILGPKAPPNDDETQE